MVTVSEHHFEEAGDSGRLSISIREVMHEGYGLYVWPSSIALAEYVWQNKGSYRGKKVLELGAGTGLPGVVAAKAGALVTLTDRADLVEVLDNMNQTCTLNAVKCTIVGLTWGDFSTIVSAISEDKPEIVLGADVLYDGKDFDDLFATVSYLLEQQPDSKFVTTYQRRSGHRSIEYWMAKWGLQVTRLTDVSSYMPLDKLSGISCSVELVEIRPVADRGLSSVSGKKRDRE